MQTVALLLAAALLIVLYVSLNPRTTPIQSAVSMSTPPHPVHVPGCVHPPSAARAVWPMDTKKPRNKEVFIVRPKSALSTGVLCSDDVAKVAKSFHEQAVLATASQLGEALNAGMHLRQGPPPVVVETLRLAQPSTSVAFYGYKPEARDPRTNTHWHAIDPWRYGPRHTVQWSAHHTRTTADPRAF